MSVDRSMRTMFAIFLLLAALFVAMNRVVDSAPAADWWLPAVLFILGAGLVLSPRITFGGGAPEEQEPALPSGDIQTYRVSTTSTQHLHTMTIRPDPESPEYTAFTVKKEAVPEVLPFIEPQPASSESPAPVAKAVADDLTRIVGIGPKSAAALKAAGIDTFQKLADASRETIHEALDDGNVRLVGDVHTWARQAAFAARGDWDGMEQAAHTSPGSD